MLRQMRQQLDQSLPIGHLHLAAVVPLVLPPARVAPRLRQRPAHPACARRELGHPCIVIVEPRVVGLLDAARRPAHRADPEALAARTRRAETDDGDYLPRSLAIASMPA